MRRLFLAYRVLATVVGVLLTVLVFVGVPLEYLTAAGSSAQRAGESITLYVGVAHGWLYIAYLVVAFVLARRARFSLAFTLLVLAAGLLPIAIFFIEAAVARRVRADFPETR